MEPQTYKESSIEKLATKLTDLKAELEAVGLEVHAARATADGFIDELIKLTAEKAALKTELTTRTTKRSHTLAYKTEKAGRYREKLKALEGGIIEILLHEHDQFEIQTPMCDSDIDSSHQKPSNMISNSPKRLTPSVRIRLLMARLASLSMY